MALSENPQEMVAIADHSRNVAAWGPTYICADLSTRTIHLYNFLVYKPCIQQLR